MYLIVAFAVTVLVIVLAWRGIGVTRNDHRDDPMTKQYRQSRPLRYSTERIVAPDDDPEFLSEIDRRLRGEDKSN